MKHPSSFAASRRLAALLAALALPALAAPVGAARAQPSQALPTAGRVAVAAGMDTIASMALAAERPGVPVVSRFRSNADSVAHERTRAAAEAHLGMRVIVLLESRELAVMNGADTLMVAPVAIGMDTTINFGAKSWTFETPRGTRKVLGKEKDPVWVPPEWHYAEVASKRGLKLAHLKAGSTVSLADGRALTIKGGRVGLVQHGGFTALPADEEIVFDGTLFVPPHGTANRRIPGELGKFKLDLGNGYLLHGTPYENTIGNAATHGCVRLYEEDIAWLYENVPVGTPVFIY
ncbi:L,D-transpeptidase [Roseisolibacter sp. H3M3-2]|uniref:L,D-transpeptidase n=1 Tax=Roseisolibacter sp. H3M3-2 TaxID=3031323 RepID=UPI0023DCD6FF|nr:L,D-transpeptidase [Roseisolibacter sp. H3M3-2]MDF1502901.1 L,D-transpeptidase [Roseisolibacter sp. H3M3-2]